MSKIKTNKTRQQKLRDLMQKYGLSRKDVQEICYSGKSTIDSWLLPDTSKAARPVPEMALELISLKAEDFLDKKKNKE